MTESTQRASLLGYASAAFGGAAGVLQLSQVAPGWTGNKNDPVTLGMVSLIFGAVIALGAWLAGRSDSTRRSLLATATLAIPSLVGLTTAGAAWMPAAVLGLGAAAISFRAARRQGSVVTTLDEAWPQILLYVLALIYVFLGVAESGWVGLIAVAGGVAVGAAGALRYHRRRMALVLLIAGAIPFAVLAPGTVVPVFTCILMLAIGLPALSTKHPPITKEVAK